MAKYKTLLISKTPPNNWTGQLRHLSLYGRLYTKKREARGNLCPMPPPVVRSNPFPTLVRLTSAQVCRVCDVGIERGDSASWHCRTERNRPSSRLWPAQLAWHTFLRAAGHSGLRPLTSAFSLEGATFTRCTFFHTSPFKSRHFSDPSHCTVGHDCGRGCGGVYPPEGDSL